MKQTDEKKLKTAMKRNAAYAPNGDHHVSDKGVGGSDSLPATQWGQTMTKLPSPQTIEYWLDFFAHVADERLSPPQAAEAKLVLSLTRSMPAAYRALKAARPYLGNASVQNMPFAVPASFPLRLLNAAVEQLERNVR